MDIKNVFKISSIGFLGGVKKATKADLKLDSATDRDGNGQTPYQKNPHPRELTQEELEHAVKKLEAMAPVQEHKWTIEFNCQKGKAPEILVKDNLGHIIKKISTLELIELLETPAPHKGQILKKSA
jgi:hypothetical protein